MHYSKVLLRTFFALFVIVVFTGCPGTPTDPGDPVPAYHDDLELVGIYPPCGSVISPSRDITFRIRHLSGDYETKQIRGVLYWSDGTIASRHTARAFSSSPGRTRTFRFRFETFGGIGNTVYAEFILYDYHDGYRRVTLQVDCTHYWRH